jgi:hypothetical protein
VRLGIYTLLDQWCYAYTTFLYGCAIRGSILCWLTLFPAWNKLALTLSLSITFDGRHMKKLWKERICVYLGCIQTRELNHACHHFRFHQWQCMDQTWSVYFPFSFKLVYMGHKWFFIKNTNIDDGKTDLIVPWRTRSLQNIEMVNLCLNGQKYSCHFWKDGKNRKKRKKTIRIKRMWHLKSNRYLSD